MMTTLPILKDKIVDSFTHQIIATSVYPLVNSLDFTGKNRLTICSSNYQFKETIVFIVHDPYVGTSMVHTIL
jgi:hypothetical protein